MECSGIARTGSPSTLSELCLLLTTACLPLGPPALVGSAHPAQPTSSELQPAERLLRCEVCHHFEGDRESEDLLAYFLSGIAGVETLQETPGGLLGMNGLCGCLHAPTVL